MTASSVWSCVAALRETGRGALNRVGETDNLTFVFGYNIKQKSILDDFEKQAFP